MAPAPANHAEFNRTALASELRRRLMGESNDATFRVVAEALNDPLSRGLLFRLAGDATERLQSTLVELDRQAEVGVDAVILFADQGWAPSGQIPLALYEEAIAVARSGDCLDEAESVLVNGWGQGSVLDYLPTRVAALGAGDPQLGEIMRGRGELVRKAWEHHRRGAYEASVPIVLAQVDGITSDVTAGKAGGRGRSFFDDKYVPAVDDATIAGLANGLPVARMWWARPAKRGTVTTTTGAGAGGRHAIMHGLDTSYANERLSTKAFVLLLALWEWANPQLRVVADGRKVDRYAEHAGSQQVDSDGRRLDRRGFVASRDALRQIVVSQIAHRRHRGRYAASIQEMNTHPVASVTLPGNTDAVTMLSVEGDQWLAWSRSEAGWVFAVAATGGNGWADVAYWDGPEPPAEGPPSDGWRHNDGGNWSGDCRW